MVLKDTFSGTNGFVRDKGEGRGVRVTAPKVTDLSLADPETSISPQEASKGAQARKTKLAVMGLSAGILDAGDPRYAACIRLANSFRKARTRELYQLHGHVSSGVSALLAASAMALASSRFLYEVAASSEDGRPDILSKAAKLSDSARQNELSAWELCAREAQVRKRNDANLVAMPWVTDASGKEVKRRGRPRKALVVGSEQEANNGHVGETEGSSEEAEGIPSGGEDRGGD